MSGCPMEKIKGDRLSILSLVYHVDISRSITKLWSHLLDMYQNDVIKHIHHHTTASFSPVNPGLHKQR